jgi:glutathione S-transferase
MLAGLPRLRAGAKARPSKAPRKPLELFSFESSPYSRRVRELLCELELPYLLRSTGKAGWRDLGPPVLRETLFPDMPVTGRTRTELLERAGKVQVPYLVDPNTGVAMFESAAIRNYLLQTYAT